MARDYNARHMAILVGIAGGTGSGKTSFAQKIHERAGAERCLTLAQDSYYKDGSGLGPAAQAALKEAIRVVNVTDDLIEAREISAKIAIQNCLGIKESSQWCVIDRSR
jgi:uridine kinase